jgi:hypothetical protein
MRQKSIELCMTSGIGGYPPGPVCCGCGMTKLQLAAAPVHGASVDCGAAPPPTAAADPTAKAKPARIDSTRTSFFMVFPSVRDIREEAESLKKRWNGAGVALQWPGTTRPKEAVG